MDDPSGPWAVVKSRGTQQHARSTLIIYARCVHAFHSFEEEDRAEFMHSARHGYAQSLFNDTTGVSGILFIRIPTRGQGFVQDCYDAR